MFEEDASVKKSSAVELGGDISTLSVEEIRERIEAFKMEIIRLEEAAKQKSAHLSAAEAFFKT